MKIWTILCVAVFACLLSGCASDHGARSQVCAQAPAVPTVYVLGCVAEPGAVSMANPTLIRVMAVSGVDLLKGDAKAVVLKRAGEKNVRLNLTNMLKNGAPDVSLKDGDILYVPESTF